VAQTSLNPQALSRNAQAISPGLWLLAFATVLFGIGAALVSDAVIGLVMLSVAGTLGCLSVFVYALSHAGRRTKARMREHLDAIAGKDAAPCFTTDEDGVIGYQNTAAAERFGTQSGTALIRAMGDLFANPSVVLFRLQNKAMATGTAREDVVTRRGHLRLAVHQMGGQTFFWRLEELVDRNATARGAETLGLPMLTASKSDTVLFMNEAMRRLVGGRVRSLDRIFQYLPLRTGEEVTLTVQDGVARAIVAELEGAGGRREIYLLPTPADRQSVEPAMAGFEDLPVALLRLSPEGHIEAANRLARELLGLGTGQRGPGEAEAVADFGLELSNLLEGLGRPIGDWLNDAMAGRAANHTETLRAVRRPGDIFLRVTLRRVVENARPSFVAVLNDMTEYKSLEAQFVQSQKMQAIGQLAGGIAHDFNNLLTAISGHCDLLLLRHDRADPDYGDLVQIHQNANRAASLVRQLLAFSRKQRLMPEIIDIHEVLSDLTHLLDRLVGETVTLDLQEAERLPPIRADKRQLEQVIMNLVVNACDAMPSGGRITLETSAATLREPVARGRAVVPVGDYVVIRVRDEGTGIEPEIIEKIFEPFFTTKGVGKGTGLGLSMAYGIVKQTGGFIFVDSTLGAGTTFTLYFQASKERLTRPAEQPAPNQRPRLPDSLADAGRGVEQSLGAPPSATALGESLSAILGRTGEKDRVILLVEDEAPVRAFATRALQLQGYTVLEADTAETALARLDDPDLRVDLFVTDVVMPGMDGPTWVQKARETRPDVRVIFISGYADGALNEERAIPDNAVLLPKPFSLEELAGVVRAQFS
jgi:two-component system cell cycle sensor histidine kinase/response regulator CckA